MAKKEAKSGKAKPAVARKPKRRKPAKKRRLRGPGPRKVVATGIGFRLAAVRAVRGMTVSEFAKKAGLHHTSVYSYESGTAKPKLPAIFSISEAHSLSLDWLMLGAGSAERPNNRAH